MNSLDFVKITIQNEKFIEENTLLIEENNAFRKKINSIYKDWLYDSKRYQELKEKYELLIISLSSQ